MKVVEGQSPRRVGRPGPSKIEQEVLRRETMAMIASIDKDCIAPENARRRLLVPKGRPIRDDELTGTLLHDADPEKVVRNQYRPQPISDLRTGREYLRPRPMHLFAVRARDKYKWEVPPEFRHLTDPRYNDHERAELIRNEELRLAADKLRTEADLKHATDWLMNRHGSTADEVRAALEHAIWSYQEYERNRIETAQQLHDDTSPVDPKDFSPD